ncbi:hypothetical protein MA6G0728R_4172 [Mycobacteroides abscessus 6G-0728-R]|uniref:Uncharacterized protein n=2 Tax=Mycobacteroides abscessus TaxID=36809 RepID=A0A829QK34_9MYCO|nr:hypothetical protein MA6G0125S_4243 [Mycobacteroides abscessus 6G-0125-S]EIU53703.1 hypothetical protein MA6G0728S_3930 [Mycobacteroides abscessus 6G-0728-S]EIU55825.1 hypothetical protein MA6G1108_4170 [Mycobacteroides abscessus 6G-1108]EIU89267.1 hypothetical protein MA6G0212_4230 [Mycobacteroides abscessus 6G-0212]EIU95357.1 hypothetical protein MA6G0728R_4172 [Mycobacteroides abscessus 6G-0728-R]EIV23545.1 hypothetical protein MA3A0122R_4442 [Mycobacteroides abscessus 3A-0122-R]EIV4509
MPSAAVSRQSVCAIVLSGTIIVVRLAQGGSAARAVATG